MATDPVHVVEYEALVLGRHLAGLPGRTRRRGGVLDQSAYALLTLLESGGPTTIGDLADITGLDASTLNRQTAALLRQGYADRIPDPDGGKARKFRTSPAGRAALDEERRASWRALADIMADWAEDDRAALGDLLGQLNRAIEDRSGRPWPRPE
jgi:DNA-binding MarR family transcriptional regulator